MKKIYLSVLIGVTFLTISILPIMAQSGCVGDPCIFETPTPGPTPTATTPPGTGTPTAVPMADPYNPFPDSFPAPTSIPLYSFPPVPSPIAVTLPAPPPIDNLTPTPFPMPSVISLTPITLPITGTTPISLTEIDTSISISYSELLTVNTSGENITGTAIFSSVYGLLEDGQALISDVVSYTQWITTEMEALQYTNTLTIATAPDWYAPYLPREMADIGWTFELMSSNIDNPVRYGINTYAFLIGYSVAMPVKLGKMMWGFFRALGPFGVFLIWLFVFALPAVMGIRIGIFFKNLLIKTINFTIWIIDWIRKIWEAIPFN